MSVELWRAILNPSGPEYDRLKDVFSMNRVPLKSPKTITANLGPEKDVPVYMLDLAALPLKERARLFGMVAQKFEVSIAEVEQIAAKDGFPIREADVIVSYDSRAFV